MIKRVLYRVLDLDNAIKSEDAPELGMRVATQDRSQANVISSEVFGKPGFHAPAIDLDNHGYDDRMSWSFDDYCKWRNRAVIDIVQSYLVVEPSRIYVVPSKTKGHSHLYVEEEIDWPL